MAVPVAAFAIWAGSDRTAAKPVQGAWTRPLAERRADPFPRTFVNAAGESVQIEAPPQNIVSSTVFSDAILLEICPAERIRALHKTSTDDRYSPVHDESAAFPRHHGGSPEEIFLLEPDLVIVSSFSRKETRDLLSKHGCPVLRFMGFDSVEDIQNNIRAVGYVLGLDDQAERLVERMQESLDGIARGREARVDWRVMYFCAGRITGIDTTFESLLDYVGAHNVAADMGIVGSRPIHAESVLIHDPPVVILPVPSGGEEKAREAFVKLPGFETLQAVRNDRILFVPAGWIQSTSHHAARAAEHIAEVLDSWRQS